MKKNSYNLIIQSWIFFVTVLSFNFFSGLIKLSTCQSYPCQIFTGGITILLPSQDDYDLIGKHNQDFTNFSLQALIETVAAN